MCFPQESMLLCPLFSKLNAWFAPGCGMLMRLMCLIEVRWEREGKEGQRKRGLPEREGVCRS